MAIAFVVGTTAQNNGGGTTSPSIDTSGADLIVISASCSSATIIAYLATISDNKSNTWLSGGITQNDGSNNAASGIVYCINPTVGSGHTFTYGGGSILQSICVAAYSGVNAGFDTAKNSGASGGSFTVQPGSVTPNQNNSLIIVAGTAVQVGNTLAVNQSFTIRENQPLVAGQTYGSWIMDLFQGTAAAVNPTITSDMNSNGMAALAFVFKGAAVSASVNLDGVSGTAAAGTLTPDTAVSVALSGVSATAAIGALSVGVDSGVTLTGVSATAAVGSFATDQEFALSGVSAAAAAGSFALVVSSTVALTGVQATAGFGLLPPTQVLVTVPILTIMNDNPVPVEGDMVGDYVPMEEDMPNQIALETVLNTFPIPMTGTLSAVPIPAEGSVP